MTALFSLPTEMIREMSNLTTTAVQ